MASDRRRLKRIERDGVEVDGVIVAFQHLPSGSRPVVRWVSATGELLHTTEGLPVLREEWRARGDFVRMRIAAGEPAFALAAGSHEVPLDLQRHVGGRRVEAVVTAHVPELAGGTRVQVRFHDRGAMRTMVLGPLVRIDPREPDDVIDLGLEQGAGAIVRRPRWI